MAVFNMDELANRVRKQRAGAGLKIVWHNPETDAMVTQYPANEQQKQDWLRKLHARGMQILSD